MFKAVTLLSRGTGPASTFLLCSDGKVLPWLVNTLVQPCPPPLISRDGRESS